MKAAEREMEGETEGGKDGRRADTINGRRPREGEKDGKESRVGTIDGGKRPSEQGRHDREGPGLLGTSSSLLSTHPQ